MVDENVLGEICNAPRRSCLYLISIVLLQYACTCKIRNNILIKVYFVIQD